MSKISRYLFNWILLFYIPTSLAQQQIPQVLYPSSSIEIEIGNLFGPVEWCPDATCLVAVVEEFQASPRTVFVQVFDTNSGRLIANLGKGEYIQFAFSPNSRWIVVWSSLGSELGFLRIFSTEDFELLFEISNIEPFDVLWSGSSEKLLWSDYHTNTLNLWDVGTEQELLEFASNYGSWSTDEAQIIAVDQTYRKIHIYDSTSGELLTEFTPGGEIKRYHTNQQDNRILVEADELTIWNIDTQEKLFAISSYEYPVSWSVDGSIVFSNSQNGFYIYNTIDQVLISNGQFDDIRIRRVAWNSTGTYLALAFTMPLDCQNDCLESSFVWDIKLSKIISIAPLQQTVYFMSWREGFNQLILNYSYNVVIWDVDQNQQLFYLSTVDARFPVRTGFKLHKDGSKLLTWWDHILKVWNIPTITGD